jgi:hypothetical protein
MIADDFQLPELENDVSNPAHKPTDQQRATVKAMSAYGIPQEQVARVLDIDSKTLRLHYRDELDLGVIEANAKVAETLFKQGTRDGNTAALIWWTKSRMGWKETQRVELDETATKEARDASVRAALDADT